MGTSSLAGGEQQLQHIGQDVASMEGLSILTYMGDNGRSDTQIVLAFTHFLWERHVMSYSHSKAMGTFAPREFAFYFLLILV